MNTGQTIAWLFTRAPPAWWGGSSTSALIQPTWEHLSIPADSPSLSAPPERWEAQRERWSSAAAFAPGSLRTKPLSSGTFSHVGLKEGGFLFSSSPRRSSPCDRLFTEMIGGERGHDSPSAVKTDRKGGTSAGPSELYEARDSRDNSSFCKDDVCRSPATPPFVCSVKLAKTNQSNHVCGNAFWH